MVTFTINGQTVEVPEGTTVLNAARQAGIEIPTLCDHPELTPYGGCRLCLVEIDGFRTLQTSCTIPATPNMVVRTHTPKVEAARKFVLTLLFSERNHFCPFCQVSGGDCELQNSAYSLGMTHWPLQPNWSPNPVDASHPYFILDHNRCILCRRCVRACGELVGNHTLGFEERGAKSLLVADLGVPLGESSCVKCGTCLQVCPTGALIDRWSAYRGLEKNTERHTTLCAGCSVGCTIDVLSRDNHLVRVEGNWQGAVNNGVLCEVGRFKPMVEKRQRLLTPLVRKDGALKAATWEEALGVVAERLLPLAGLNGHGVAAIASTRLPAEALYQFKKLFADKFGSGLVTSTEEGAATSIPAELAEITGAPFEGGLAALKAADLVLTAGEDLTETHMVAGFMVKRLIQKELKLVVLDTDVNGLDVWADAALKSASGSYIDLLRGLTLALNGQSELLAAHADTAGLAVADLNSAAALLKAAERPVFIYGKELVGREALVALIDLASQTGAQVIGVKGGSNSLAASQYRLDQPIRLNGQQAGYIALGDEEPSQRLTQQLEGLPFLAVQASYASQLTAMADVVLPVETYMEHDGHFLNLDGRLQNASPAMHAPEAVRPNASVLIELAVRLGMPGDDRWQEALCERIAPVQIAA